MSIETKTDVVASMVIAQAQVVARISEATFVSYVDPDKGQRLMDEATSQANGLEVWRARFSPEVPSLIKLDGWLRRMNGTV